MLDTFGITPAVLEDLRTVRPLVIQHIDRILDAFYDKILNDPVMGSVFNGGTDPVRARDMQRAHWVEWVFAGRLDATYYARCKRIGRAHKRHNVVPASYLFGYHFMSREIKDLILKTFPDRETAGRLMSSVEKALFLDIDLAISCYCTEMTADWRRASLYDELTGVMNRRGVGEAVGKMLPLAKALDRPVSVALLDIDHFKSVNDTHGHDAGDKALMSVACLIADNLRDDDFVARWGGEEFLIVMPGADRRASAASAERIRMALAGHSVPLANVSLKMTASLGVSQLAGDEDGIEAAVARADAALYQAKHSGRNRTVRDVDVVEKQTA